VRLAAIEPYLSSQNDAWFTRMVFMSISALALGHDRSGHAEIVADTGHLSDTTLRVRPVLISSIASGVRKARNEPAPRSV